MSVLVGPVQERIIRLLAGAGGPMRLSEIAEALGIDSKSAYAALAGLARRGIVARRGAGVYELAEGFDPSAVAVKGAVGAALREKIVALLRSAGRPMTLKEISEAAGADPRVVQRILAMLAGRGVVVKLDTGLYALDRGFMNARLNSVNPNTVGDVQKRIIVLLARAGRPLRVGEIAAALGVKPHSIYNTLHRLVERRILARERRGLYKLNRTVDPGLLEPAREG